MTTCYRATATASCEGVPESGRLPRTANSYSAVQFRLDVIRLGAGNSHACCTAPATTVIDNVRRHLRRGARAEAAPRQAAVAGHVVFIDWHLLRA
ncbi:hypothetical protein [Actinoplanes sp. NPDC020271]|uniref:hypothetical protein n=1 Tax=Actinoplanes sp. NPDC020271 TaxID=3363896 RepID=UPI00378ACB02